MCLDLRCAYGGHGEQLQSTSSVVIVRGHHIFGPPTLANDYSHADRTTLSGVARILVKGVLSDVIVGSTPLGGRGRKVVCPLPPVAEDILFQHLKFSSESMKQCSTTHQQQ